MRWLTFVALSVALGCASPRAQDTATEQPAGPPAAEDSAGPRPDLAGLTTLRFVTESDYPPFHYYDDDGQLAGLNVELARAICRELTLTCDIRPLAWDTLTPAVASEDADAIVASLAITPQATAALDFTASYYQTPAKFVFRSDRAAGDVSPRALAGKTIAVVAGSAHEAFLREFYAAALLKPLPGPAEARAAVKDGAADALFGDAISLMFWLNGEDSGGCCRFRGRGFLEPRYFGEGVGIAVKRGNARVLEALDYALARIRGTGRLEELMLRYFPQSPY